jgi:hypothetical protein
MFRFGSRSLFGAALFGLLLVAGQSYAQTVSLSPATFEIKRKVARPTGEFPYAINYDDCVNSFEENDDDRTEIHMRPVISGWDRVQDQLEVWVAAGRDCKQNSERTATGLCRRVAYTHPSATNELIIISPAVVVKAIYEPGNDPEVKTATPRICDSKLSSNLKFYVMFIAGGEIQGTGATWDKSIIDVAPATTPENIKVSPGDQALFPSWNTVPDTDLNGFTVFCEQISCTPGATPPPDTGAAGAAGSAGVVDPSCVSTPTTLVPGKHMSTDEVSQFQCAFSGGKATVTEIHGDRLENGACYSIGVASKDTHGNISTLSDVSCGTPKDVITFYESYSNAGGKGGGEGLCQFSPGEAGSGIAAFGGLLALLGKQRTQRTRKRKTSR